MHTTSKCILCVCLAACCMCVGGILCPIMKSSSLPPCFLSDVVKKAILDAFQISEGKQCHLWHRYMRNSYEQVKGEQGQRQWHTVSSVGLWDGKARLCVCWFRMYFSPHVPALHLLLNFLPKRSSPPLSISPLLPIR